MLFLYSCTIVLPRGSRITFINNNNNNHRSIVTSSIRVGTLSITKSGDMGSAMLDTCSTRLHENVRWVNEDNRVIITCDGLLDVCGHILPVICTLHQSPQSWLVVLMNDIITCLQRCLELDFLLYNRMFLVI